MKFHHIGIACKDIHKTIEFIKSKFHILDTSEIVYDEKQDAYVCMIQTKENVDIELISGKRVENLINKGITYYHICYTVSDIHRVIKEFMNSNCVLVSEPKEAVLFNYKKVAFLYTPLGLIELLEE